MNTLPVTNPRTGEIDYRVPNHDSDFVAACATRLRAAQPDWESLGVERRCDVLLQWKAAIADHAAAITDALCADTGRYLMAQIETRSVQDWIGYWSGRAPALIGSRREGVSAMAPGVSWQHRLKPYPLVGVISPWNVPLILGLIDLVPALLAGCAVMLKPSEVTPRFAAPLRRSIADVPELAPVLEIVTGGPGTGQALIDAADAVCFTGSVPTGRKVAARAAANFIPAFLELGGKDPAIVLPSADLDKASDAILRSAAGMTGQACQSLERIYVHGSVFDDFVERLVRKAKAIEPNWPDLHRGHLGPFIFPAQAAKVQTQLDQALAEGATLHCGGMEQHGGWWCRPVVLTGVNHDMQIMREETFGPVLPVMPFHTIDEALAMANDSEFGLSGAVFGGDTDEAIRVAEQVVGGAISVNDASLTAMVHDVEKNSFCASGLGGSRMGDAGLTRFLRKRAILVQSASPVPLGAMDEANAVPGD